MGCFIVNALPFCVSAVAVELTLARLKCVRGAFDGLTHAGALESDIHCTARPSEIRI